MGLRVSGVVFKLETRSLFLYLIKATRACDNQTRISKLTRPSLTFNSVHSKTKTAPNLTKADITCLSIYNIFHHTLCARETQKLHKHHLKPKKKTHNQISSKAEPMRGWSDVLRLVSVAH